MIKRESCIVCNSKEIFPFLSCTDHFVSQEKFEIVQCNNCGFKFTQGVPDADKIGPYYHSEEYISHSDTQKGIVNRLYHTVRNIMLKRKAKLIGKLTEGKKLLDIGCGTGYFPYFMSQNGYEASGMELDEEARKFAKNNFNISVHDPNQLLNMDKKEEFDVITLWHVLEHLHDPLRYLNWINKALKENGVLLIALPNCNSHDAKKFKQYWAAYDVPRHLWHFEPETFQKYIEKFGFQLKLIKRLPFDAYYNAMVSTKYASKPVPFLTGGITGYISNLKSLFNAKKTSSVIYVLKKN